MAGCAPRRVANGPLQVYSSSLLIRPGSPAKYLNQQLASFVPAVPSEADKQLFAHYDADGKSIWASNWTSRLDFSGVAWDHAKAGTLIHPQHVVFASHFPRSLGEELTFHDRSGRPVRRRITEKIVIHRVHTPDVTVAKLDRPVPGTITHYPLLPPGHDYRRVLEGAALLVTDQKRRVHVFRVNAVRQRGYEQLGARPAMGQELGAAWRKRLEKGDSGHPAFIILHGRLILVSTLRGGGWASKGPFYGGQRIQSAVIDAIQKLEGKDSPRPGPSDGE